MRTRLLVSAGLGLLALWGCGPATCPPPPVQLPSEPDVLLWAPAGYGTVPVRLGGPSVQGAGDPGEEVPARDVELVMDTGFPQSAITPTLARGMDVGQAKFDFPHSSAGPMRLGLLLAPVNEVGVLGGDVVHQLPMRLNARGRYTEILPGFAEAAAYTAPLEVVASQRCRGATDDSGAAGPFALLVEATVDGLRGLFVLDTGAQTSFVRSSFAQALEDRPRLENVWIASAFAGNFPATATRARSLSVGAAESPNALVLSSPAVDAQLERLSMAYSAEAVDRRRLRVDGFLGWSFLREFEVELHRGFNATDQRGLRLVRFDAQDHWSREFVGIGITRAVSVDPPGILVAALHHPSPAEGLLELGDVIVKIDGVAVTGSEPIVSTDGDLELEVVRRGQPAPLLITVPYRDLLPDPTPSP